MAENPFGDDTETTDDTRRYMVLIAASQENLALVQQIHKNIQNEVDKKAFAIWVDSRGIGIVVETGLVASEIQKAALAVDAKIGLGNLRGFLIVEIGADWATHKDAKTEHWMASHVGNPRPAPPRKSRRR
ncbi:hypothetical protein H0A71_12960 [Alcaligenaceae bacterium]|nr:hypothetical protein [Alcaligenaceae bacterium]